MKYLSSLLIAILFISSPASAATRTLSVREISPLIETSDAELLAISGSVVATVSNIDGDIAVSGRDLAGKALWNTTINSSENQLAYAITVDSLGDFWLAGSASTPSIVETSTIDSSTLNPDGVVLENLPELRSDLTQLNLWKIGITGEVKGNFNTNVGEPFIINAFALNNSGTSLVGSTVSKIFLLNSTLDGKFGKTIPVKATSINSVVRLKDGSINLFGSSGANGLLLKMNDQGRVIASVPSTAPKTQRRWLSSTTSLLLGGDLRTSKSSEIAITKFAANFKPTWTMRFAGKSPLVVSAGNSFYAIFQSTSAIPALRNWKPSSPSALILALDSKGSITAAYSAPQMGSAIAATYSKSGGLYILAKGAGENPVSIFRLTSG